MMEGSQALCDVENNGMRIDVDYLDRKIVWAKERIRGLESDLREDHVFSLWRRRFGQKSDLGKREQLAYVIHEELGYEVKHISSKTGKPSTDAMAFEHVDEDFLRRWDNYDKLKRLLTTNLIGIRSLVDPQGFLHPTFNLHFAKTYRSSANDPNFQNQPIRDKRQAKLIRRAFVPRDDDFIFAEVDQGALEFRGGACFWRDPEMVAYASDPTLDIHRDMASECYVLERDNVSKTARGFAKNKFVFPTFYGSWFKNTARGLWDEIGRGAGIQTAEGVCLYEHLKKQGINNLDQFTSHIENVEKRFNERFSYWAEQKDVWWKEYLSRGWFPLMTGFTCKGTFSRNNLMNTPIQGPSFHLVLWALIELNKWLKKYKMKTKIIGQVHDSIAMDIHRKELQDVLNQAEHLMTVAVRKEWDWIIVPLEVEAEASGVSWFDKKVCEKKEGLWTLSS